jgi:hypothetical protein
MVAVIAPTIVINLFAFSHHSLLPIIICIHILVVVILFLLHLEAIGVGNIIVQIALRLCVVVVTISACLAAFRRLHLIKLLLIQPVLLEPLLPLLYHYHPLLHPFLLLLLLLLLFFLLLLYDLPQPLLLLELRRLVHGRLVRLVHARRLDPAGAEALDVQFALRNEVLGVAHGQQRVGAVAARVGCSVAVAPAMVRATAAAAAAASVAVHHQIWGLVQPAQLLLLLLLQRAGDAICPERLLPVILRRVGSRRGR